MELTKVVQAEELAGPVTAREDLAPPTLRPGRRRGPMSDAQRQAVSDGIRRRNETRLGSVVAPGNGTVAAVAPVEDLPLRPRRVMSEEQKRRMREGRQRAAAARRATAEGGVPAVGVAPSGAPVPDDLARAWALGEEIRVLSKALATRRAEFAPLAARLREFLAGVPME